MTKLDSNSSNSEQELVGIVIIYLMSSQPAQLEQYNENETNYQIILKKALMNFKYLFFNFMNF